MKATHSSFLLWKMDSVDFSTNTISLPFRTPNCWECPPILFARTDERAVVPARAHETDIGYDLTAIDIFKLLNSHTTLYETGIVVKPPAGCYVEILPRSSLSKTGHVLANSVGVIDPDYTGSLKIAVTKVVPDAPDLQLPFTRFQIVLRPIYLMKVKEVSLDQILPTERGSGGFGSTDAAT